jgi:flagellin-like hook-associated protein FlgL
MAGASGSKREGLPTSIAGVGSTEGQEQPFAIPNFADYLSPEARKWARIFFSSVGIVLSLLGFVGTVVAYLFLSSAASSTEKIVLGQLDGAVASLSDLEISLANLEGVKGDATNMTGSIAASFRGYSTATSGIADSLSGVADSLSGIPLAGAALDSQVSDIQEKAQTLKDSAQSMSDAANSAESAGGKIGATFDGVSNARSDIGAMIDNLERARGEIRSTFGLLSAAMLAGMVVLMLLFASVGSACLAALL